jgi:hypothetical protein
MGKAFVFILLTVSFSTLLFTIAWKNPRNTVIDYYFEWDRHMSLKPMKVMDEQNKTLLDRYFVSIGLGKMSSEGEQLQVVEQGVGVFAVGDRFCIVGVVKEEVNVTGMTFDLSVNKFKGSKYSHTDPLPKGGFAGYGLVEWPVGRYEFRIYVDGTLVASLPFKVR